MIDPVSPFLSELFRAAHETERLAKSERARLLHRAAATLRDYHHRAIPSDAAAGNGQAYDKAREWSVMAQLIEEFSAEEVSKALLHAAACIKASRVLAEVKWKKEPD